MAPRLLLAALALSACTPATAPDPAMNAPAQLAAAESAFAATSVREGMRAAFLANLAEDSLMLRPGPVDGRELFEKEPAELPIVLDWRPVHVEVAASGEMGLSTGPWTITRKADPKAPPRHGQFVSVWKRSATGRWELAVDLGIRHPGADLSEAPLVTRQLEKEVAATGIAGIAAAEASFDAASRSLGARGAYAAHASETLRLYRDGAGPAIGRSRALASPALGDERLAWTIERAQAARSGEFGYAFGSYAAHPGPGRPQGYFVRVWRFEGGAWRIALDVVNPLPPA